MSALVLVDAISGLCALTALILTFRISPHSGIAALKPGMMALFSLVLLSYTFHFLNVLTGVSVFDAAGNYAEITIPLAFFFLFYAWNRLEGSLQLQATEERYRALFESGTDGFLISDTKGEAWDANPALCAMFGYDRDELLRRKPWHYLHPDNLDEFRISQKEVLEGKPYRGIARGMRKDGSFFRAEVSASLVRFAGKPYVMSFIRDITAQAEAEEARERLVAVLDATTDLVGTSDPQGGSIYMNTAGRRMLGIREDEDIAGMATRDFHTPESYYKIIREGMPEAIERGIWRGETQLKSRTGKVTDVSQVIVAHRHPDGEVAFLSTIARDIGERKRVQKALEDSERRLFRFMENLPVGVFILAASGETYLVNRMGRDLMGIESEESMPLAAIPKEFGVFRSGTEEAYPVSELPGVRALAGERVHVQDMEVHRDGRIIPLEAWASPVRSNSGRITHAITAILDISDRRQAESDQRRLEAQLLQSQKMESIGMLAGGVAHDFNNLLVAIVGYSELILSAAGEDAPFVEEVKEIRRAGERAAALTRQLLAFSRKQVMQPQILNLNRVVADTEKLLRRLIGENIELVSQLSSDTPSMEGDPAQLEQAIVNLAVNARDAMPDGGRLTFETLRMELTETEAQFRGFSAAGRFAVLRVTDTGFGMDEATRAKIFEPFFTTKGRERGTGLGLSTVYGIVKQTGGEIEVESRLNEGSVFSLYFPAVDDAPTLIEEARGQPCLNSRETETGTVLLVEDETAPRELSARVLREAGYEVLEAESGEVALQLSRSFEGVIDLLLSDVVLPGLGGGELAEQLQTERPETRILYASGYVDNPLVRQAVRDGGAFLQKPFKPEDLISAVRQVLNP